MRSHKTITSKAVTLAGLFFLCLFTVSNAFAYDYQITEIQPPAGYTASRAMGINNLGQVVGRFYNIDTATGDAVDRHAFVWDKNDGASLLSTLAGETSAWAINNNGFVAGYSYNAAGKQRAALWDLESGTVEDLGAFRNSSTGVYGESSTAYGINNLDQVVGSADIPNNANSFTPFHAFFDDLDGMVDLGTFTTSQPDWQNGYSIAYDINNKSEIVGIAHDDSWAFLPFIYDEVDGMQGLQRDNAYLTGEWYAVVINDSGLIGGHVIASTNQSLPYYWPNKSSSPVKITMPEGFPYGEIYGINNCGQMVGIMWDSDQEGATERAFVFDTKNGVRDLNNLIAPASGWVLHFARDINDSGQIAGYGELNGQKRGFLLNPEPGLAVAFGEKGLYYFKDDSWMKLSASNPKALCAMGQVLYADFGLGVGLYKYAGTWQKINNNDVADMITAGNNLYVHFSGMGLYRYDTKWKIINLRQPEQMLGLGSDLFVDFGVGVGLYKYNGTTWKKINPNDATGMVAIGNVLYVHFSGVGLYKYDGAWKKIDTRQPEQMLGLGTDLYADFGAEVGLYKYNGTTWEKIDANDSTTMAAVGNAIYVHFVGAGLYKYDGTWKKIDTRQPEQMVGAGSDLYADFGSGVGLYKYNGAVWQMIDPNDPTGMVAANLQ